MTRADELAVLPLSDRIAALVEEYAKGNRAEFGRMVGATRETVSRWLGGQRPDREHAEALAALASVPLEVFWANHHRQGEGELGQRLDAIEGRLGRVEGLAQAVLDAIQQLQADQTASAGNRSRA